MITLYFLIYGKYQEVKVLLHLTASQLNCIRICEQSLPAGRLVLFCTLHTVCNIHHSVLLVKMNDNAKDFYLRKIAKSSGLFFPYLQ